MQRTDTSRPQPRSNLPGTEQPAPALLASSAPLARAQDTPILSRSVSFFDNKGSGASSFAPVIAPVVVAPIGGHLLAEGLSQDTFSLMSHVLTPVSTGKHS
jgi:hypothetical protein